MRENTFLQRHSTKRYQVHVGEEVMVDEWGNISFNISMLAGSPQMIDRFYRSHYGYSSTPPPPMGTTALGLQALPMECAVKFW